jgi:hypothetical protein
MDRFRRAESDIITQIIDLAGLLGVRAFSASLKVSDRLGDGRNKFRAGKSLFDSYARNHGEGMMTGLKQHLLTLPGLGVALLPKAICPFCLPVYFNFLTSLGLGFLPSSKYLFRITFVLLLTAVSTLAFRAKQRRGLLPFELGLAASALILIGKFGLDSHSMTYGGVVLLVCASVWNAWPVKRIEASCERCSTIVIAK